jgi:ankyrin repeat protein
MSNDANSYEEKMAKLEERFKVLEDNLSREEPLILAAPGPYGETTSISKKGPEYMSMDISDLRKELENRGLNDSSNDDGDEDLEIKNKLLTELALSLENDGYYPIHDNVNNIEELEKLLKRGFSADIKLTDIGTTALMLQDCNVKATVLLCDDYKADVNIQDIVGNTALHWAIISRASEPQMPETSENYDKIKTLLKYHIDPTIRDDENITAYDLAIQFSLSHNGSLISNNFYFSEVAKTIQIAEEEYAEFKRKKLEKSNQNLNIAIGINDKNSTLQHLDYDTTNKVMNLLNRAEPKSQSAGYKKKRNTKKRKPKKRKPKKHNSKKGGKRSKSKKRSNKRNNKK